VITLLVLLMLMPGLHQVFGLRLQAARFILSHWSIPFSWG
jgi:hypothetical protein